MGYLGSDARRGAEAVNRRGRRVRAYVPPCCLGPNVAWSLESKVAMNKRQLIDDIRKYNTTAQPEFLAQFDDGALRQYLEHLEDARRKHLRAAGTVTMKRSAKLRLVS